MSVRVGLDRHLIGHHSLRYSVDKLRADPESRALGTRARIAGDSAIWADRAVQIQGTEIWADMRSRGGTSDDDHITKYGLVIMDYRVQAGDSRR